MLIYLYSSKQITIYSWKRKYFRNTLYFSIFYIILFRTHIELFMIVYSKQMGSKEVIKKRFNTKRNCTPSGNTRMFYEKHKGMLIKLAIWYYIIKNNFTSIIFLHEFCKCGLSRLEILVKCFFLLGYSFFSFSRVLLHVCFLSFLWFPVRYTHSIILVQSTTL